MRKGTDMRRFTLFVIAALVLSASALAQVSPGPGEPAGTEPAFTLSPSVIEMGAFYGGATINIEGTVPLDSKVAVAVKGDSVEEVLNRKARAGLIWVNSGKVHVSGIPSLLLVFSQEPIGGLLSRQEIDRYQLDAQALMHSMKMAPPEMDQQALRADFFKLKERQGIYRFLPNTVSVDAGTSRGVPFRLSIPWSKKAPPGHYEVTVYAIRDNSVISKKSLPLEVRETGFPAWMASLAQGRPMLYGLLAILCALAAGFGIDFIASKLGKPVVGH